jgi:molybdopterin synthase catalytic subunit
MSVDVTKKANVKFEISIQSQDFNLQEEVDALEHHNLSDGAVVTFTGRVRNQNLGVNVTALHLEHYPGMTENALGDIIKQAKQRWPIARVKVIHRIGTLTIGEKIVFVGVTSPHRGAAFQACEFIMDYLKVNAPFWKKELTSDGERWLEAKTTDHHKAQNWHT